MGNEFQFRVHVVAASTGPLLVDRSSLGLMFSSDALKPEERHMREAHAEKTFCRDELFMRSTVLYAHYSDLSSVANLFGSAETHIGHSKP